MIKYLLITILALVFTIGSLAIKTEGHICGPDRGSPLPIITPICGATSFHIPIDNLPKCTRTVFDYGAFIADIGIFWAIIFVTYNISVKLERKRNINKESKSKHADSPNGETP
ncbi:MAG: hypothetical protein WAX69_04030 [Victivallales bacterium]